MKQIVNSKSRQTRRAERLARYVVRQEAPSAARQARVDYRTPGETGALVVPAPMNVWHLGNRLNGHQPKPGQAWDRAGLTVTLRSVEANDQQNGQQQDANPTETGNNRTTPTE